MTAIGKAAGLAVVPKPRFCLAHVYVAVNEVSPSLKIHLQDRLRVMKGYRPIWIHLDPFG